MPLIDTADERPRDLVHLGSAQAALAYALVSASIFSAFVFYAEFDVWYHILSIFIFLASFLTIFSKNLKFSHVSAYDHAKVFIYILIFIFHLVILAIAVGLGVSNNSISITNFFILSFFVYLLPLSVLTISLLLEESGKKDDSSHFRTTNQLFIPAFATVLIPFSAAIMLIHVEGPPLNSLRAVHYLPNLLPLYAPTIFVALRAKWRGIEIKELYLQLAIYALLLYAIYELSHNPGSISVRLLLFTTVALNFLGVLDVATRVLTLKWEQSEAGGAKEIDQKELSLLDFGIVWSSSSVLALCALLPLILSHTGDQRWITRAAFAMVVVSAYVSGILPVVKPITNSAYKLMVGSLLFLAIIAVPWGWGLIALPSESHFVFAGGSARDLELAGVGTLVSAYGVALAFVTILFSTLLTSEPGRIVATIDPRGPPEVSKELAQALQFVTIAITATVVINFATIVVSFWIHPAGVAELVFGGLFSIALGGIGGLISIGISIFIAARQRVSE